MHVAVLLCAVGGSADDGMAYARLLARHVRSGTVAGIHANLVDYRALARDPDYHAALREFAEAKPEALRGDGERFAFWTNAYNLLAIKTIVDRYPIASIRDGGSLLSPIWKKTVGTAGGREVTLDEIEHGILRKEFREPRVHFAVVCASLSCPDLRAEPYVAERLDTQLDEQARTFLGNRTKGLVPGADGKSARVSSIFDWFDDDFDAAGGVVAFIRAKAPPEVAARIAGLTDGGLDYLDYDWSLNDAARASP
jgi:hypothetical protein